MITAQAVGAAPVQSGRRLLLPAFEGDLQLQFSR
jgi:hypothetical protein